MMAGCWERTVRAVAAIGAASLLGCVSDLVAFGEGANAGYRHRWRGYEIGRPASHAGQAWERFQVEGIDLAFGCRAGNCGTCRLPVLEGEVVYWGDPAVNPGKNGCLACMAVPASDLKIDA